jgi:hypothetical protein
MLKAARMPAEWPSLRDAPRPEAPRAAGMGAVVHADGHDHHHGHAGHNHVHPVAEGEALAEGARQSASRKYARGFSLLSLSGGQRLVLVAPPVVLLWVLALWAIGGG